MHERKAYTVNNREIRKSRVNGIKSAEEKQQAALFNRAFYPLLMHTSPKCSLEQETNTGLLSQPTIIAPQTEAMIKTLVATETYSDPYGTLRKNETFPIIHINAPQQLQATQATQLEVKYDSEDAMYRRALEAEMSIVLGDELLELAQLRERQTPAAPFVTNPARAKTFRKHPAAPGFSEKSSKAAQPGASNPLMINTPPEHAGIRTDGLQHEPSLSVFQPDESMLESFIRPFKR